MMDIMLTISYSVKIPGDKFFYLDNGYIKEEMREKLEKLFPEEIVLTEDVVAQREHLIYYPLHEKINSLRCASCGKWLYMPGKEYLPICLDYCKMINEIPLCSGCAWELQADLKNEEFLQKLRQKNKDGVAETMEVN